MNTLKFSFIVICFLISLKGSLKNIDCRLLASALFFTTIADYFLLISHKYEIGIAFFCIAHFFYWLRYKANLKFLFFMFLGIFPFIIFKGILISIAMLYSLFFLVTLVYSFKYRSENSTLIKVAMILFLICDILVAIYNLTDLNLVFLIWIFYAPSQIMLALSGRKKPFLNLN